MDFEVEKECWAEMKQAWREDRVKVLKSAGGVLIAAVALYGMAVCFFAM